MKTIFLVSIFTLGVLIPSCAAPGSAGGQTPLDVVGEHTSAMEERAGKTAADLTKTGTAIVNDAEVGKKATPPNAVPALMPLWIRLVTNGRAVIQSGTEITELQTELATLGQQIEAAQQKQAETEKALAAEKAAREKENGERAKRWDTRFAWVSGITLFTAFGLVVFAFWSHAYSLAVAAAAGGAVVVAICVSMGELADVLHKYLAKGIGVAIGVCVLWVIAEGIWRAKKNKTSIAAGLMAAIKTSPVQDVADIVTAVSPIPATTATPLAPSTGAATQ
jgi:hypothetical protein